MDFSELKQAFATVVAIPVTPFATDGVDFATYACLVERMIDSGITVVTPNGNTSEFYSLTAAEQRREGRGHDGGDSRASCGLGRGWL